MIRVRHSSPAGDLPATAAELPAGQFVWIDLENPTADEEEQIFGRFLPVHPLTREDVTRPRRETDKSAHLPKVEEFPDYLFVIVNPLPWEVCDPAKATAKPVRLRFALPQLSAILTERVLVTHHYDPLPSVSAVHDHVAKHPHAVGRGPDYLFHLVLDNTVDEYAPVVERIADRLDRMESALFRRPDPTVLARLLRLKRRVSHLRKTMVLEREVLARLVRGEFALVDERELAYYRNVFDHLVRYTELLESAREMVSDLMQTHLSAASNRLNEVMKVLTMISTIILPMTLIAGIYGMNFETNVWPDFKTEWGFGFAIGTMLLTAVAALGMFRWKRWI